MRKGKFIRDFGARVRALREERGMSQETLAFDAGLHRTAVSHVEQATRSSTLETVEKLARVLGVEPADLMRLFLAATPGASHHSSPASTRTDAGASST